MWAPEAFLVLIVLSMAGWAVARLWLVARLAHDTAQSRPLDKAQLEELRALRTLVDDLRETAWEHRELDSPLATIILDKIRSYERGKHRPAG